MKEVKFIPQKDIEEYLKVRYNTIIYKYLKTDKEFNEYFPNPLDFFNLLYKQITIIEENFEEPYEIINQMSALNLNKQQLLILFDCLLYTLLLMQHYKVQKEIEPEGDSLWQILFRKKLIKLTKELYPYAPKPYSLFSVENNPFNPDASIPPIPFKNNFNFEYLREILVAIPDIKEKIKILFEAQTNFLQNYNPEKYIIDLYKSDIDFDIKCSLEIEKLKKLLEFKIKTKNETSTLAKTKPPKPELLVDIWVKNDNGKKHYQKAIDLLKSEYLDIDTSFITESNEGLLFWNKSIKGSRQYLAAFIYIMTIKKWISKWYSAPEYQTILQKTFNSTFDHEPFKNLAAGFIDDKYIKPFKNFPENC